MRRKTHELTADIKNPNVSVFADNIEEEEDYVDVDVLCVDKKEFSSGVRDQKVPSVFSSVLLLARLTLFWITLLLIMSLRIYYTSIISKNITKLTIENQQLKAQNVGRAQWTIDEYCGRGSEQCKPCQRGWLYFQSSCFLINDAIVPYQRTWEEAREDCRGKNSDLAVIVNEDEKTFTTDNSWNETSRPIINGYWIGLRAESGRWTWINGSFLTEGSWMKAPPTNNSCAISVQDQEWNSVSCDGKNAWICKKQALSV